MRQNFDAHTAPSFGSIHAPRIRNAMGAQGLDGFFVPREDEHQNESPPPSNDRLAWATGFTGSAGAAVILSERAAIFTDGRYALQVRDQVDEAVYEIGDLYNDGLERFLTQALKAGDVIGYDPRLHSPSGLEKLSAIIGRAGASLKAVEVNPLDQAWGDDRPAQPAAPVMPHPLRYAGVSSAGKRAQTASTLRKAGAKAAVLTAPASIAWLFNVRGGDTPRAPLPLAQAVLHDDGTAELFLDPAKSSPELTAWLGNEVAQTDPAQLKPSLEALAGQTVMIDPSQSSVWYFDVLTAAGAKLISAQDPCALPRAAKNTVEVEGARKAHRRDGAALVGFLHWLGTEAQTSLPDEVTMVSKLEGFREATGQLRDLSFDTIAGAGPNSAVIHYRPTWRTNRRCEAGSLILVDSGGQYIDGTTDVTRTVAIGSPTDEMRRRFTLVLKGHLAIGRLRFPVGTTGSAIDALARVALWAEGLDFDHGVGHGVGSFLGVHEGPHSISKAPNNTALVPGMIVSNEPGYYKPGEYGIRIENLVVVTAAEPIAGGERDMLGFETLTLAPYDRRLIALDLLTEQERQQIDTYHARVLTALSPALATGVRGWLDDVCANL